MSRVVITDAAVISPIGNSPEEVFHSLDTTRRGIGHVTCFDSHALPVRLAAEVKEDELFRDHAGEVDRKQYFLRSAFRRMNRAGGPASKYPPRARALAVGGGLDYFDLARFADDYYAGERDWLRYSCCTHTMVGNLCVEYGYAMPFLVNVSACVASSQAIGTSYRRLRRAEPGTMIVTGGFDSMLNRFHYMGFYKLGALSTWEGAPEESCRPFDKRRCGLVLGEGAALYALQKAEEADPRSVLAEIAGYASTGDGYMVTDPEPDGRLLAKAALSAIKEAGLSPDEIDCVHLHGTGTLKNDPAEARALKLVFGERSRSIPVYSMKGQIGHLIAACGAVELMGVLYSIIKQKVPATANYCFPDPDIPLNVVKGNPLELEIKNVLKLNSAFGGQNTALVVGRYGK